MDVAITALALVATVTAVAGLARRFNLSAPLLLTLVGLVASFLPFVPEVHLSSEVVLVGLLPPLLYAAAIRSSLVDFKENRRPIGFLSVGLVIFTALGVGLVTWWLLPVPFAAAFALGAVVAPPDAVAATAIARRIGLPRRVVTVLEGESLVNDATALVCLRTAIGRAGRGLRQRRQGGRRLRSGPRWAASSRGGRGVAGRRWSARPSTTASTDTSLSFMAPFVAYLPAEELAPPASSRSSSPGCCWGTGPRWCRTPPPGSASASTGPHPVPAGELRLPADRPAGAVDRGRRQPLRPRRPAIVAVVPGRARHRLLLRPIWVFPVRFLAIRPGPDRAGRVPSWRSTAIISWAGMRGVVTLAAVFALPEDTPQRRSWSSSPWSSRPAR